MSKYRISLLFLLLAMILSYSTVSSFADKQLVLTEEQKRQLDQQGQELKQALEQIKKTRKSLENLQTGLNDVGKSTAKLNTNNAALARQQLPAMEKSLGSDNPRVLTMYEAIGLDYLDKKQYAEAERTFNWLLAKRIKVQGSNSKDTAEDLLNLATCKQGQKNYAEAIPLYQRSLKIFETAHGSSAAWDLAQKDRSYMGLIQSYDRLGKKAEAEKWREAEKAAYSKAGYGK